MVHEHRDQLDHIVIRQTRDLDIPALQRLAQLDDKHAPTDSGLVAEVRGRLIAYVSLAGGRTIADPFERTADVVAVLRLRAAQMRGEAHTTSQSGRVWGRLSARRRYTRGTGADVEGSSELLTRG